MSEKNQSEQIIGVPFKYTDLVDYQTGSIVSRIILKKTVGTITLFAFDAGQSLSPHSTPYEALVEIVEGKAMISIEDTEHPVSAGQQIILPAGKTHAVDAPERFKMVLTMIKAD